MGCGTTTSPSSYPEQHIRSGGARAESRHHVPGAGRLEPARPVAETRGGVQPGGRGKTALKASLNRYLLAMGPDVGFVQLANPSRNLVTTATRTWTDTNGDFIPDCDLTAATPGRNGECGPLSDENFGTAVSNVTFDEEALTGLGKRNFNWEFSAGVQQELMPNVSLDVSYFRRWYGNFVITDDLAIRPEDFDRYSITAPTHPDLPGGGGYVVDGLYNIKPEKFSVASDPLVTLSRGMGKKQNYWDGADFVVNARPGPGMFFQGGVSTGRRVTDNCDVVGRRWSNPKPAVLPAAEEPLHTQVKAMVRTRFHGWTCSSARPTRASRARDFGRIYGDQRGSAPEPRPQSGGRRADRGRAACRAGGAGRRTTPPGRFSRLEAAARGRGPARVNLDIYNALNGSAVLELNNAFEPGRRPARSSWPGSSSSACRSISDMERPCQE